MQIDDAFLEDAILNLYATCVFGRSDHAMPAGASLDLASLREEWAEYHLRQDDLDQALKMLVARGELAESGSGDRLSYALTKNGLWRGTKGRRSSLFARWQTAKDLTKLTWAQNRPGHGEPEAALQRRRSADHHGVGAVAGSGPLP